MCSDDPVLAEQKSDRLWLFAWACAARLGWDLNALLRWFVFSECLFTKQMYFSSNVVRVFSMVSRLFEHTFNIRGEVCFYVSLPLLIVCLERHFGLLVTLSRHCVQWENGFCHLALCAIGFDH